MSVSHHVVVALHDEEMRRIRYSHEMVTYDCHLTHFILSLSYYYFSFFFNIVNIYGLRQYNG